MPAKISKTSVSIAPLPADRRVLSLAAALGVTTRIGWAIAAESWAWLAAEAGEDGVVPGAPALLDAVVDAEGAGAALVTAELVVASADGLALPVELLRASRLLDGGGDVAREDRRRQKARDRSRKWRKRTRLSGPAPTRTAPASGQQPAQIHVPRSLGKVCGDHVVMLLWGPYGPFVELKGASPPVTASAAAYDYDSVTLADALELLVPRHKANKAEGGGYRVPTLQALEDAARLERERQRAADAAAAREAEGNGALLEAAAHAEDEAHERDGDAPVTLRARHARHRDAPRDAAAEGELAASPSRGTDLDAGPRDAPRDAPRAPAAASSSSSLSMSSSHAQKETTTRTTSDHGRAHERDGGAHEAVPAWVAKERQDRERARAAACAAALGVTVAELKALYQADREGLRQRLEAAGVDPVTGHPLRAQGRPGRPTSASSAAQAAGIPLPDLGVGRLRSVADQDVGVDAVGNAWSPRDDQIVDEPSAADQDVDLDNNVIEDVHERDAGLGVDELVDVDVGLDVGLDVDADQPVDADQDADAGAPEPADLSRGPATVDAAS